MKRPVSCIFCLALTSTLFGMYAPEALNFGLPLREARISIVASLFLGSSLALLLTPKRSGWDVRILLSMGMGLLLSMAFLVRTVVVFHVDVWPVVAIVVIGSLFYFLMLSPYIRQEVCDST